MRQALTKFSLIVFILSGCATGRPSHICVELPTNLVECDQVETDDRIRMSGEER